MNIERYEQWQLLVIEAIAKDTKANAQGRLSEILCVVSGDYRDWYDDGTYPQDAWIEAKSDWGR